MKKLTSVAEVVEVLGGIKEVAKLTHAKKSAALNWLYVSEAFPPNTFKLMNDALEKRGCRAPAHLWKMRGFEEA